jgi:hypothetical protein
VSGVAVIGAFTYAVRVTAGIAPRPEGREARRIERRVNIATTLELAAALAVPVIVIAAGHSDWVLPSIVITIGPLLLYLDHLVHIPRYRLVGWVMTARPVVLVAGSAICSFTSTSPASPSRPSSWDSRSGEAAAYRAGWQPCSPSA